MLYLGWPRLTFKARGRRWVWVLCYAALIALIIWSRLYLGVHKPIDVSASVLIGGGWLLECSILFKKFFRTRPELFPARTDAASAIQSWHPKGNNPIGVLVNASAGTFKREGPKLIEQIHARFQTQGRPFFLWKLKGSDLADGARRAIAQGAKTIVVAGGDGSVSAVAGALVGSDVSLGVLPLGTLNHLAGDLGIPTTLEAAIDTVLFGEEIRIDVGVVNGHVFLNNSSLGLYPSIVLARDREMKLLGMGKWRAFIRAAWRMFRILPIYDVAIEMKDGAAAVSRHTPFVFVGNNAYSFSLFNMGERACINRGILSLHTAHNIGRGALVKLVFHALFQRLDQASEFDTFETNRVSIHSRRNKILISTDGEVLSLKPPLHYEIKPAALRVCVPKQPAASKPNSRTAP